MNSPLGKYAPAVAAIVCGGTIVVFLLSIVLRNALQINDSDINSLKEFAILAFGVVSGTALGVNGWKREVQAIHTRLDQVNVPPADNVSPEDAG